MTTTASITRCWQGLRHCACLLALLLGGLAPAWQAHAQSQGAEITQMRVERSDDGVHLTAAVKFDLGNAVEDALGKGIPMFFVAEAVVLQDRWFWYDKRVAGATRHMRLSYQPLTRRWRLQVSANPITGSTGLSLGQNFDSREEALAAIARISSWKIAEPGELEPDARYSVEFRFRLDVSQLPRPFQIGAVGQSDWSVGASRIQRLESASTR